MAVKYTTEVVVMKPEIETLLAQTGKIDREPTITPGEINMT